MIVPPPVRDGRDVGASKQRAPTSAGPTYVRPSYWSQQVSACRWPPGVGCCYDTTMSMVPGVKIGICPLVQMASLPFVVAVARPWPFFAGLRILVLRNEIGASRRTTLRVKRWLDDEAS